MKLVNTGYSCGFEGNDSSRQMDTQAWPKKKQDQRSFFTAKINQEAKEKLKGQLQSGGKRGLDQGKGVGWLQATKWAYPPLNRQLPTCMCVYGSSTIILLIARSTLQGTIHRKISSLNYNTIVKVMIGKDGRSRTDFQLTPSPGNMPKSFTISKTNKT